MTRLGFVEVGGSLSIKLDGVKVGPSLEVPKPSNSKGLFSVLSSPFRFLKNQISHIKKDENRTSIVHVKLIGEDGKTLETKKVIVKTDSVRKCLVENKSKNFVVKQIVSVVGNDKFDLEIRNVRIESATQNRLTFEEFLQEINPPKKFSVNTVQPKKSSEAAAQENLASSNQTFANVDSSVVNKLRESLKSKGLDELQKLRYDLRRNIEKKQGNPDKQKAYLSLVDGEIYLRVYGVSKPTEPQVSEQTWNTSRRFI